MARPTKRAPRVVPGDLLEIVLPRVGTAYALALPPGDTAFWAAGERRAPEVLLRSRPLFRTWVNEKGRAGWPRVAKVAVPAKLVDQPWYAWRDEDDGATYLRRYDDERQDFASRKVSVATWMKTEPEAIWEREHIEERLRAVARGRPSKFLESLRRPV